ncbi:MAG: 2-C-methyl-D-erythritol 2,4-cyclodiphosphate synthase [Clostridia bacterium]|nr:2-C-methyl-D-erythritol 2,4-cyclodiphosphate synthase [Clostridia bacterium]
MSIRIGHGYDVHKLVCNRELFLGGVQIPYTLGLLGHSDADVLLHAICDALLGAAALGDIGKHFPDNDDSYKNIDSKLLLKKTVALISEKGYAIANIDATVIAQMPKLAPYIDNMRKTVAKICGINVEAVNIKATTEERLGFTGRLEGISAHAVVLIEGNK